VARRRTPVSREKAGQEQRDAVVPPGGGGQPDLGDDAVHEIPDVDEAPASTPPERPLAPPLAASMTLKESSAVWTKFRSS
jgi:hypothetical protein